MNKRYLLYGYSHSFHKKNEVYGFSGKTKLLQQWLTFILQEYPEKWFSSAFPNLFGKDTTMFLSSSQIKTCLLMQNLLKCIFQLKENCRAGLISTACLKAFSLWSLSVAMVTLQEESYTTFKKTHKVHGWLSKLRTLMISLNCKPKRKARRRPDEGTLSAVWHGWTGAASSPGLP